MHGYYGHTLKLVNKQGQVTYAQFHLNSNQGTKTLTNEEAAKKSPDYGQADLFYAVSQGAIELSGKADHSADDRSRMETIPLGL